MGAWNGLVAGEARKGAEVLFRHELVRRLAVVADNLFKAGGD